MKFQFSFERILKNKKITEDQARRDFNEISRKLDEQQSYLNLLQIDLKKSYNDKYQLEKFGGGVSGHLSYFHEYHIAHKKLIENQEKIIDGLGKILEEKRQRLVEAAKEHKMFEKLKEKKKQEFRTEQNKLDQKRTDEMNNIRQMREKI